MHADLLIVPFTYTVFFGSVILRSEQLSGKSWFHSVAHIAR